MIDQNDVKETAEVENSPDAPSPAETEATEEVTTEVSADTEEATETEESPKKGYQARVRELNAKAKTAEQIAAQEKARAESLEVKIAELTGSVDPQGYPAYNPQTTAIAPGEEINAEEFEKRVLQKAQSIATLEGKKSEAINRIHNETNEVLRLYPELDPESDVFDKDLSDAVTESVGNGIQANPYTASVKAIAAKLMKPYKGAVDKEVGKAAENIAKQVSETALRPTAIRKDEKPAHEKSIQELEKELGVVQA